MAGVQVLLLVGVLGVVVSGGPPDLVPCVGTGATVTLSPNTRMTLETPGFPRNYPTSKRCQWTIECPPEDSTYLDINCKGFSLAAGDHLIYKLRGVDPQTLVQGDSFTTDITPTGWARLTFKSDISQVSTGFRCFIWCRLKTTTLPPTPSTSPPPTTLTSPPPSTTTTPQPTTTTTAPPTTTTTAPPTTTPPPPPTTSPIPC